MNYKCDWQAWWETRAILLRDAARVQTGQNWAVLSMRFDLQQVALFALGRPVIVAHRDRISTSSSRLRAPRAERAQCVRDC